MSAGPWFDGGTFNDLPRMHQYGVRTIALIRAALVLELGPRAFYAMDDESEGGEMDRVITVLNNTWTAKLLANTRETWRLARMELAA